MRLYTSNRAELLVGRLAEVLRRPSGGPFDPEVVLVHSPGMGAWLRQRIAEQVGICANVRFPFPARYLPELFERVLGDEATGSDKWTRSQLRWAVLAELPLHLDHPDFASVRGYLVDAAGDVDALKLLQLSERIGRVFWGYLFHRPLLIERWQAGPLTGKEPRDERWQATLWTGVRQRLDAPSVVELARDFQTRIEASTGEAPPKKKRVKKAKPAADGAPQLTLDLFGGPPEVEEVEEVEPVADPADALPNRICLFGVSSLPPLQLQLLGVLAKVVEVHAFVLAPSREFFADIRDAKSIARRAAKTGTPLALEHLEIGNPLLASLGKLGRDFQHLLHEGNLPVSTYAEEFVDPLDPETTASRELQPMLFPQPATALEVLQSDILNLRHRGRSRDGERVPPFGLDEDDRSVAVHACHGAMRQVEVLHDQLLDLFRNDETLQPDDVLVMCPDLETYGPLVEAVFSRALDDPRNVPFRVADRSLRRDSPVAEALLAVLDLVDSRFSAPDVMDLLGMPAVHRRFGLSADVLPRIADWIGETGIRWGIDGAHRAAHGQPSYAENTWRFGLDRLLLGVAMRGEGRTLFADVLPFDPIEGSDAITVGRFTALATTLFDVADSLRRARTVPEWSAAVSSALERLVHEDDDTAWEHEQIRRLLDEAAKESTDAGAVTALPLPAMRSMLRSALTEGRSPYGFLTGSVTFCEMLPMRAIPFRVVAMLGMDERAFPRNAPRLGFDLVAHQPQRGDRNTRDDDRYLFLEALLSARDRLLVTYTGLSARDNKPLPPSVLVSELLDVCVDSFGVKAKRFVTQHALQPFSERYFRTDDPLFTYAHEFHSGAASLRAPIEPKRPFLTKPAPLDEPIEAVSVSELVRFFRDPVRYFFNRRLGVYLEDDATTLLDREPIVLDKLESSILAGRMLDRSLDGEALDEGYDVTRAAGSLPLGAPGSVKHEQMVQSVSPLDDAIARVRGIHDPKALPVDLTIDGVNITGRVKGLFDGRLVVHQYYRIQGDHELAVWVQHLILCAAGQPGQSRLIGRPPSHRTHERSRGLDVRVLTFRPPEHPEAHLRTLLELYRAGQEEPLLLFPRTGLVHQEMVNERSWWTAVTNVWDPWGDRKGEADRPYVKALLDGARPFTRDALPIGQLPSRRELGFRELAETVFGPLIAHRDA